MKDIDTTVLARLLADDGEFARAARWWVGSFAFSDGTNQLHITVVPGAPAAIVEAAGSPAEVVFTGPPEGWANVFAAVPPPFYQDLVGGAVGRHGFTVTGDLLTMSAYYGAIVRAAQLVGVASRKVVPA